MLLLSLFLFNTHHTSDLFQGDAIQNFNALKEAIENDVSGEITIIDDQEMSVLRDLHFLEEIYINVKSFEWHQVVPRPLDVSHEEYGTIEGCFVVKGGGTRSVLFKNMNVEGPSIYTGGDPNISFIKVSNGNQTGLYNGSLTVESCQIKGFQKPIQTSTQGALKAEINIKNNRLEGAASLSVFGGNTTYLNAYKNEFHQINDWENHNHNLYIHPGVNSKIYYNRFSHEGLKPKYALAFNGSNPGPAAHYVEVVGNTFDETIANDGVLAPWCSNMLYEGNVSKVQGTHVSVRGGNCEIRNNKFEGGKKIFNSEALPPEAFYVNYTGNVARDVDWFGDLYGGFWNLRDNEFSTEDTQIRQEYIKIALDAKLTSYNETISLAWVGAGGKTFVNTTSTPIIVDELTLYNKSNGAPFVGPVTLGKIRYSGSFPLPN